MRGLRIVDHMTQPCGEPEAPLRLLGVGDSAAFFHDLSRRAAGGGATLEWVRPSSAAERLISHGSWDLLLVELGSEPLQQLAWWTDTLRAAPQRPPLVALTTTPSLASALQATQLGVFDVLPLPVGREQLLDLFRRVRTAQDETVMHLPEVRSVAVGAHQMVSESPAMLAVFRVIAQVAPTAATVLITGESGTGKELVARAIHLNGSRAKGPFVTVNCAAIPEHLLESELFGHEKGAFTGAVARKVGRFERATGGTLFLDEIGDMSLTLQAKILRAVQEREIERVGGGEGIPIDVRLIAATHRDLDEQIAQGRFREDLYYRLAVITIELPRLAERGEDLLLLTACFLKEFGRRYGREFRGITDRAFELLRNHDWVGNVRELRNVIERAALMADGAVLRAEHLPAAWRAEPAGPGQHPARAMSTLEELEQQHIARALAHTAGQIGQAAEILGVHRNTLARKIKKYSL